MSAKASPGLPAGAGASGERSGQPPEELCDRAALLERAGPQRRKIFQMVRGILDDLEASAPWTQLYFPPQDDEAFLRMERDLVRAVDGIPARVEALLADLATEGDSVGHQTLEDIDFYFAGIHDMVASDLVRLDGFVEDLGVRPQPATPEERYFVCELTADLKGKYSSAIMGAAASIISEGLWDGVEIEPVLFPEKKEEFERNERLLESLQDLVDVIDRLPEEIPFRELLHRWERGKRVDPYALATLQVLTGKVALLLQESSRRALYSGDYQQIRRLEGLLGRRVAELDALQRSSWESAPPAVAVDYPRLRQLLYEVAAIVNVEILGALIGKENLQQLRKVASLEKRHLREISGIRIPVGPSPRARRPPRRGAGSSTPSSHSSPSSTTKTSRPSSASFSGRC